MVEVFPGLVERLFWALFCGFLPARNSEIAISSTNAATALFTGYGNYLAYLTTAEVNFDRLF